MKKVVVILVFLIVLSTTAFATPSVDVKSMSDAELEGLRDLIDEELASREIEGSGISSSFPAWYDFGLGQYIPDPSSVFGRTAVTANKVKYNNDRQFCEWIEDVTPEEFELYYSALRDYGYNTDIDKSSSSLTITKDDGTVYVKVLFFRGPTCFQVDLVK